MAAASFALLKGQAKATAETPTPEVGETQAAEIAAEVDNTVLNAAPAEEAVEVDIETMTGPQLDELVKEHEVPVPTSWWKQENGVKKLTVPEKKAWLNAHFGGDEAAGEEAVPETVVGTSTPVEEPAAAPATLENQVSTGKKKSTAVAKAKPALTGEVLETDDTLADMVHQIENLAEKAARDMVMELAEAAEFTYFKLGGVLSRIQSNSWFAPFASFRDFVETEHGLNYRKAMYWIAIYNELTQAQIPWAKVKHIGWTKLKEIAGILTPENLDEWVKIAETNNTLQLIEIVSAAKKKAVGQGALTGPEQGTVAEVSTKTFKVHTDQKATIEAALDKARKEASTPHDTVALEFICLDYLGAAPKALPLVDMLKKAELDAALQAFADAFPEVQLTAEVPS